MRINIVNQGGYGDGGFNIEGATLTGPLILAGDPTQPLEAATKKYIDLAVNSLNAGHITTGTLPVGRLPAFGGDLSNNAGSNSLTLANTTVIPGTYTKVTVDAKGRVTNGTSLTTSDIPNLSWNKITNGRPNTVDGYGITDVVKSTNDTLTGHLTLHANPANSTHAANKQYVDNLINSSFVLSVGDTVRRPSSVTPTGFLRCNGGEVSKTTYSALFTVIGDQYKTVSNLDYTSYTAMGAGQPWRIQSDFKTLDISDLSGWTAGPVLPPAMINFEVLVTKNRVYVLGGTDSTNYARNSVYYANINADGTLGTWSAGAALPVEIREAAFFVTKNRVYMAGGQNLSGHLTTTYTASINADGTLGTWTTGPSLTAGMAYTQPVVTKNKVYLVGGSSTDRVLVANINSDGTIGAWSQTTPLPQSVTITRITVIRNKVYLLHSAGSFLVSTIDSNGTLGTWSNGPTLPGGLSNTSIITAKNRVFIIGGSSGGNTAVSTVYTAPINSDGTLGAFTTGTPLSTALAFTVPVITKNKLHLLGGQSNGGPYVDTVYTTSFTGNEAVNDYSAFYNGTINKFDGSDITGAVVLYDAYVDSVLTIQPGNGQPWRQQNQINTELNSDLTSWSAGSNLPVTIYNAQVIVTKNRVYLIGGVVNDGSSGITYTAILNSDGTLGSWTNASLNLPAVLKESQAIVVKNKVYLLGGVEAGSPVSKVYNATINTDGTLSAWSQTTSLPVTIYGSQAVITNNRVYLLGGYINGIASSAVYTAPINSDGTLDTWTTGTSLPETRAYAQAAVVKTKIYLIGGLVDGSLSNDVRVATINEDGTIGAWTNLTSLPGTTAYSQVVVTSSKIYLLGGDNGASVNFIRMANINADGTLGSWTSGTNLPAALSKSQVFITKNRVNIVGGFSSGAENSTYRCIISGGLNDYSVYYDGSIVTLNPNNFRLPDTTLTDPPNIYTFIKY